MRKYDRKAPRAPIRFDPMSTKTGLETLAALVRIMTEISPRLPAAAADAL